jgi:hypothetical protein
MGRHSDETIEGTESLESELEVIEVIEGDCVEILNEPSTRARPARHCAECGLEFTPIANNGRFCCAQHRRDYGNREQLRGAQLLRVAYHHRRLASGSTPEDRKDSGAYLSAMSRMIDGWIREDLRESRMPPLRPGDL